MTYNPTYTSSRKQENREQEIAPYLNNKHLTQKRLRKILDHIEKPVIVFNQQLNITDLNTQSEKFFNYSSEQLKGVPLQTILPNLLQCFPHLFQIEHWREEDFLQTCQETLCIVPKYQNSGWTNFQTSLSFLKFEKEFLLILNPTFEQEATTRVKELPNRHSAQQLQVQHSPFQQKQESPNPCPPKNDSSKGKKRKELFLESQEFRERLVKLMNCSLDYWEQVSGKDKFDLAKESGLWKCHLDGDTYRTRVLDQYLSLAALPQKPRWNQILKTVKFIIDHSSSLSAFKKEIKKKWLELAQDLEKHHVKIKL